MSLVRAVAGILIVFGGIVFVSAGYVAYQNQQSDLQNAVRTDAVVERTDITKRVTRRDRDDDGYREPKTTFKPRVTYSYAYEGNNYTSSSVYSGGERAFDSRRKAREVIRQYSQGREITAYVNSERPSRAFLIHRDSTLVYGVLVFLGVVLGLLGAGVTISEIRSGLRE